MRIRGDALELAFRIVLSCPCPVTSEQEARVFAYLRGLAPDEVADYDPVLAIFDSADTPFHGLAEFTGWMGDPSPEATIEREHVLRCNGSGYHWQLAAESLPSHSRHVSSVSRWLLSHTVVPVTLARGGRRVPARGVPVRGRLGRLRQRLPAAGVRPGRLAGLGDPSRRRREPAERLRGHARLAAQRGEPAARPAPRPRRADRLRGLRAAGRLPRVLPPPSRAVLGRRRGLRAPALSGRRRPRGWARAVLPVSGNR